MSYVTVTVGNQVQVSGGNIPVGTTLTQGQWVISTANTYLLIMQTDGNLVLYQVIGTPPESGGTFTGFALWSTGTDANGGETFSVQTDGNLVVYNGDGSSVWSSGTTGLAAANLAVQNDGNLVLYSAQRAALWATGTDYRQVWPKSNWSYIQYSLSEQGQPPLVLTAGSGGLTLSPAQTAEPSQMWQFTPDGRLLSGLLGSQVLTQQTASDGTASLALTTQTLPPAGAQIWACSSALEAVAITAGDSGLAVSVGSDGVSVQLQSLTGADAQQWFLMPANPLQAIMALPPATPCFPAFTTEQQEVYADINQRLDLAPSTLREQYTNLNAPIDAYQSSLLEMTFDSFQPDVWKPVVDQLNNEMIAVIAVQRLFNNYIAFHNLLFSDQDALLSELATAAGFETQDEQTTGVWGVVLNIVSSIVYTVLSANPATAVAANIIEGAVNVGVAASNVSTQGISASPFQVTVAQLAGKLSDSLEALLSTVGDMATTILTDWTKLQTTAKLCTSFAPNGLAWPPLTAANLVKQAKPSYVASVMQMLLQAKYRIYEFSSASGPGVVAQYGDAPSYAKYASPQADGNTVYYWIADANDYSIYPASEAMTLVWGAGVPQNDFFAGNNGWGLPKSVVREPAGAPLYDILAITLTNLTPNMLTVTADCTEGSLLTPANTVLAPYSTLLLQGQCLSGLQGQTITFTLYDPSAGPTASDLIAQFSTQQDPGGFVAGKVWVDGQSTAGNYTLTTPVCYPGSIKHGYSGSVQIGVARAC